MSVRHVTPILNVSHIGASFEWFEKLGWNRGFSWNDGGMIGSGIHALGENASGLANFGSVCCGDAEIFLCRDGQGARSTGPNLHREIDSTDAVWMSWWVDSPAEVDAIHTRALAAGMLVLNAPQNEPWNVREFLLRHPDGHTFRIGAGCGSSDNTDSSQ